MRSSVTHIPDRCQQKSECNERKLMPVLCIWDLRLKSRAENLAGCSYSPSAALNSLNWFLKAGKDPSRLPTPPVCLHIAVRWPKGNRIYKFFRKFGVFSYFGTRISSKPLETIFPLLRDGGTRWEALQVPRVSRHSLLYSSAFFTSWRILFFDVVFRHFREMEFARNTCLFNPPPAVMILQFMEQ